MINLLPAVVFVSLALLHSHCLAMNLRLRKSSLRDLDAIARVVAASSYQEPANAWKYPDRDRYPDDAYQCLRVDYLKYIRNDEQRWHCMVTEKVEQDDQNATIIAVALWEVSAIPELAHEKPHSSASPPGQTGIATSHVDISPL
jgi:hypothetical protein